MTIQSKKNLWIISITSRSILAQTFYLSLLELERHSNPFLPWNMQGALSVSTRNQPCGHPIRFVRLSRVCLWISSRCIRATVMEHTLFCILYDLRYVLLSHCVTLTLYFVTFKNRKLCMIISKSWDQNYDLIRYHLERVQLVITSSYVHIWCINWNRYG